MNGRFFAFTHLLAFAGGATGAILFTAVNEYGYRLTIERAPQSEAAVQNFWRIKNWDESTDRITCIYRNNKFIFNRDQLSVPNDDEAAADRGFILGAGKSCQPEP